MQLLFCLYKPVIREWELSLLGCNENLNRAPLCSTGLLLPRHNRNKTTVNHCLRLPVPVSLLLPCVSSLLHKLDNVITKLWNCPYLPRTCFFVAWRLNKKPLHNSGMYVWAMLTIYSIQDNNSAWNLWSRNAPTHTRCYWHHFSHGNSHKSIYMCSNLERRPDLAVGWDK